MEIRSLLRLVQKCIGSNLESIVLFGSYTRDDFNVDSDIDILVITKGVIREEELELKIKSDIDSRVQIMSITKEDFKNKVIEFNHQLISIFYDGKILYDKERFYYKMENLFLALNRKKNFTLKVRRRIIRLSDLRRKKSFV